MLCWHISSWHRKWWEWRGPVGKAFWWWPLRLHVLLTWTYAEMDLPWVVDTAEAVLCSRYAVLAGHRRWRFCLIIFRLSTITKVFALLTTWSFRIANHDQLTWMRQFWCSINRLLKRVMALLTIWHFASYFRLSAADSLKFWAADQSSIAQEDHALSAGRWCYYVRNAVYSEGGDMILMMAWRVRLPNMPQRGKCPSTEYY